jgi:sulfur relay (sulfurtransferase) complex TusBCD TusD component (DsrE family)
MQSGLAEPAIITGARRSTMDELASVTILADRLLVF